MEAQMKEQEDRPAKLQQERDALKAALEAKEKEISEAENLIASSSGALEAQRNIAATALESAERAVAIAPDETGPDDDDLYVLASIDQIRLSALEVVHSLLYPSV